MVKCKYEGTGIWDGRCTGTKEVDPCLGYDKCKQYKPNYTTNADRIRAMSDEELKDFLFNKVSVDSICNFCVPKMRTERKCDGHCKNGILEWLKQPADMRGEEDG